MRLFMLMRLLTLLCLCSSSAIAWAQDGLAAVDTHQLHNVWRLSPRILSGSEPADEAAFAELARLGVKTIVSVDGIAPRVDLAQKYGLRYVHVPIGYDGIDQPAQGALTRVAQEITGSIYIHCHHGKHRGPAAAAIVCRADDGRSAEAARVILEKAGTGQEYPGLWRDVAQYVKPPAGTALPTLTERAAVESLASAMAKLDRTFDRLKLFSKNQWQPLKDHPDVVARLEAVQLTELFTEAARSSQSAQLKAELSQAATSADSLRAAIQRGNQAQADQLMSTLTSSCVDCHKRHRNN